MIVRRKEQDVRTMLCGWAPGASTMIAEGLPAVLADAALLQPLMSSLLASCSDVLVQARAGARHVEFEISAEGLSTVFAEAVVAPLLELHESAYCVAGGVIRFTLPMWEPSLALRAFLEDASRNGAMLQEVTSVLLVTGVVDEASARRWLAGRFSWEVVNHGFVDMEKGLIALHLPTCYRQVNDLCQKIRDEARDRQVGLRILALGEGLFGAATNSAA